MLFGFLTLTLTVKCTNLGLIHMLIGKIDFLGFSHSPLCFEAVYQSSQIGPFHSLTKICMSSTHRAMHRDTTVTEPGIVPDFGNEWLAEEMLWKEGHHQMIWSAMTRLSQDSPSPSVQFSSFLKSNVASHSLNYLYHFPPNRHLQFSH